MKLTVITNQSGEVTGTVRGHAKDFQFGEFSAGLIVSKGDKHYEVEVPDEFDKMGADELHESVTPHLKKAR